MSGQVFSDGIGSITIIGGTVRIDFMVLSPNEQETNGQPKAVHLQRIVMGPEGFLRSAEKIQEAAQTLLKLVAAPRLPDEPHIVEASLPQTGKPAATAPLKRPFP